MDAVAIICARCGMDAKQARIIWKGQTLLKREVRHPVEPAGRTHRSFCPGKAFSNLDKYRQQPQLVLHMRCCRLRSLSGYNVAISIPTDKSNISE